MPFAFVHCATFPKVTWLNADTCSYADEVAVFSLPVSLRGTSPAVAGTLLQLDEAARAQRYHREVDRHRFVRTRTGLRRLLGRYLRCPPDQVRITTGVNQKPEVTGATGWHFNVSHAGDWALIAVAKEPVGVDVERIVPDFAFEDLIAGSFAPAEQQHLRNSADARRLFYQLWTRKEALVKATAKGIDDDFRLIPSLDGEHRPADNLLGRAGRWVVRSFSVADDYPAAVAHGLPSVTPRFYQLTDDFGPYHN